MRAPWLDKDVIERRARNVIAAYESREGATAVPPIPVEAIAERGLGLQLSFEDLRGALGLSDVLGATYVKSKRISIDESLVDDEPRLNFTCAHEIGHWELHRHLVEAAARSANGNPGRDTIFCRIRDEKQPMEWQSDYFAGCLLMPEDEVTVAWELTYGPAPFVLHNVRKSFTSGPSCFDPCAENWHLIASDIRETGGFTNCSKQAMIVRLQNLGLVQNLSGARLGWNSLFYKN